MFHFPLLRRRLSIKQTRRPSRRPNLERLEDRLVLSLPANGTILVANYHYAPDDGNLNALDGIVGVDPTNGHQTTVLDFMDPNKQPVGVCEDPTDSTVLYLTEDTIGGGCVLKINLSATPPGVTTLASVNGGMGIISAPMLVNAAYIAYFKDGQGYGHLYVTALTPNRQTNIVDINLHMQQANSLPGTVATFVCPVAMIPVPNDSSHFYVADEGGNFQNQPNNFGPGAIWKLPIGGGTRSLISGGPTWVGGTNFDARQDYSSGNNQALGNMVGIAVDPLNQHFLYAANTGYTGALGSIIGVDPVNGNQYMLVQDANGNVKLGGGVNDILWDPLLTSPLNIVNSGMLVTNGTGGANVDLAHVDIVNRSPLNVTVYSNNPPAYDNLGTTEEMCVYLNPNPSGGAAAPVGDSQGDFLFSLAQPVNGDLAPSVFPLSSATVSTLPPTASLPTSFEVAEPDAGHDTGSTPRPVVSNLATSGAAATDILFAGRGFEERALSGLLTEKVMS